MIDRIPLRVDGNYPIPSLYHPMIQSKDWVDMESPYLYFIYIDDCFYFENNKDIGFKNLDSSIKTDILDGKCYLILYAGDEGFFGSEINHEMIILQSWMEMEGFIKNSVHFICMNLIISESLKKQNMKIIGHSNVRNSETHLIINNDLILDESIIEKNKSFLGYDGEDITNVVKKYELPDDYKLFLNYNKSSKFDWRIYLLLSLIKNNLVEDGLISFSTHLKERFTLSENYLTEIYNFSKSDIDTFKSITPLYIDDILPLEEKDLIEEAQTGQISRTNHYQSSFLSLVSETLVLKDTIYLSEKTFKPILMGHPFMIISSKGHLGKLKELGYKTFDKWWSEEYDDCDEWEDRINLIMVELTKLKSKSKSELIDMRNEIMSVLIYNQDLYFERIQKEDPINNIILDIYNKLLKSNE